MFMQSLYNISFCILDWTILYTQSIIKNTFMREVNKIILIGNLGKLTMLDKPSDNSKHPNYSQKSIDRLRDTHTLSIDDFAF